jgi:hypothetical protein
MVENWLSELTAVIPMSTIVIVFFYIAGTALLTLGSVYWIGNLILNTEDHKIKNRTAAISVMIWPVTIHYTIVANYHLWIFLIMVGLVSTIPYIWFLWGSRKRIDSKLDEKGLKDEEIKPERKKRVRSSKGK